MITQWQEWAKEACEACGIPNLATIITWEWSNGMTKTIANARGHQMRIRVNRTAWPFVRDQKQVIVHEVCHLINYRENGNQGNPHGWQWQRLMRLCGYPFASRTTTTEGAYKAILREKRQQRKPRKRQSLIHMACYCSNGTYIGQTQYRRLLQGTRYRCKVCGKSIVPGQFQ